jgi:hypothetical protein
MSFWVDLLADVSELGNGCGVEDTSEVVDVATRVEIFDGLGAQRNTGRDDTD